MLLRRKYILGLLGLIFSQVSFSQNDFGQMTINARTLFAVQGGGVGCLLEQQLHRALPPVRRLAFGVEGLWFGV